MALAGEPRFEFGKNWSLFAARLSESQVGHATESIKAVLQVSSLAGKSFLDVGCGSGLFSLAASKLGARVHSFDYDENSVKTTRELRERFHRTSLWTVEQGSALDEAYLAKLSQFDVVYSWGVLHHTGDMWRALGNMPRLVAPGGELVVSIYNDQGARSRMWKAIKRTYHRVPVWMRAPYAIAAVGPSELLGIAVAATKLDFGYIQRAYLGYETNRGMNKWRDIVDWVGGYPFEVAAPEQVFDFFRSRGFELRHLKTSRGNVDCNEFRFHRP
jgi:2-polyprenyl-6-hydroxyphenyl methylase/3-demethylubiquinone-9 3-methyltransferase